MIQINSFNGKFNNNQWLNSPMRAKDYHPKGYLTSKCQNSDIRDHPVSIGEGYGQNTVPQPFLVLLMGISALNRYLRKWIATMNIHSAYTVLNSLLQRLNRHNFSYYVLQHMCYVLWRRLCGDGKLTAYINTAKLIVTKDIISTCSKTNCKLHKMWIITSHNNYIKLDSVYIK